MKGAATAVLVVMGGIGGWMAHELLDHGRNDPTQYLDDLRVDSIVIQRSAGLGRGPQYSVSISRYGAVRYQGGTRMDPAGAGTAFGGEGLYTSKLGPDRFDRIKTASLQMAGRNSMGPRGIDSAHLIIQVMLASERSGDISDGLLAKIESTLDSLDWTSSDGEQH